MKIALMTSQEAWAGSFIQAWQSRLRVEGIEIGCVVVDENLTRRANLVNHIFSVAKRQAKVANASLPGALLRLLSFDYGRTSVAEMRTSRAPIFLKPFQVSASR